MRAPARTFEDLLVLRSVATTQSSSGLAESASVCACGLPFVTNISTIRNLWSVVTISARRCLHCREYGDVSETSRLLEKVSKLLEAYSQSILNSDS